MSYHEFDTGWDPSPWDAIWIPATPTNFGFDKCVSCAEPVEQPDGVIDINEQGLCEDCAGRRERLDPEYIMDHDHSMDY